MCGHSFAVKTQLCWQNDSWWRFFPVIKCFLPIRVAFPAEGSADVARAQLLHKHHLCTTFCSVNSTRNITKANREHNGTEIILEFCNTEGKKKKGLFPENKKYVMDYLKVVLNSAKNTIYAKVRRSLISLDIIYPNIERLTYWIL